jgi:hypothetical protein
LLLPPGEAPPLSYPLITSPANAGAADVTLSPPSGAPEFPNWFDFRHTGLDTYLAASGKTRLAIARDLQVTKIISMPERTSSSSARLPGVRDRRFTIRYPFAADAELVDLESGKRVEGVTSDISLGGCFICTSKSLPVNSRFRLKLTRKNQAFEALVVVRIVKPRIGMGIEFCELEPPNNAILAAWIDTLRRVR